MELTYEKLFETLRVEKSKPGLQQLSTNFFGDVVEYLKGKEQIIEQNRGANSSFSQSQKIETEKQLENAKKIVKMLYDLREKKIVTMALNKSRTASSLIDTSGLHNNESQLFESMVQVFSQYRLDLLDKVLSGELEVEKTMQDVKFLDDIEEFVDPDMNKYGPYKIEEVAAIPSIVANMLVKQNKVEFL